MTTGRINQVTTFHLRTSAIHDSSNTEMYYVLAQEFVKLVNDLIVFSLAFPWIVLCL